MITARHPEWPNMRARLETLIGEAHRHLEQPLDAEATAAVRGQIAAYRRIISEAEAPPIEPDSSPDYHR